MAMIGLLMEQNILFLMLTFLTLLFFLLQQEKMIKEEIYFHVFLVDLKQKGVEVAKGYDCVSHRGYVNNILHFNDCRIPAKKYS